MGDRVCRAVVLAVLLSAMVPGPSWAQPESKKIGVLIWANEVRYESGAQALVKQMAQEGFAVPDVEFTMRRAGGSKVEAMKIATDFSVQKYDLFVSLGTSGSSAMAKLIKDTPIVFATVFDPVDANLVESWTSSKNNLTGVSNNFPISRVLELAARVVPLRSVAVLYTPNEKNSEAQLKSLQASQKVLGINIIPVPVVSEAELLPSLAFVEGKAEAIYVTGSILIGKVIPVIVDFAAKKKILTITHLADLVEKGVVLGLCADSGEQGVLAGKIAARVLKGAKPSDIPVEKATVFSVLVNKKAADAAGIIIPPDMMKDAEQVGK